MNPISAGAPIVATSISAPSHSGTFDPVAWLARYAAVGGCYAATDTGLKLCTVVADQSEAELSRARELIVALTDADKAAILAHLRMPGERPDQQIIDAWERRRAAYERYNVLPISETGGSNYTPEEQAEWDVIDAAEEVIRSQVATTPQGAAIQLWTSFQHTLTKRDDEAACLQRDLSVFEAKVCELDWSERLIVAALRSLKSMEARS